MTQSLRCECHIDVHTQDTLISGKHCRRATELLLFPLFFFFLFKEVYLCSSAHPGIRGEKKINGMRERAQSPHTTSLPFPRAAFQLEMKVPSDSAAQLVSEQTQKAAAATCSEQTIQLICFCSVQMFPATGAWGYRVRPSVYVHL